MAKVIENFTKEKEWTFVTRDVILSRIEAPDKSIITKQTFEIIAFIKAVKRTAQFKRTLGYKCKV